MSFDKALCKAAFTGIASARMRPSWSHRLKRDSSEKTTWCQSACQVLRRQRYDEADISTNVAVEQCAPNCLEEDVRSFTTMAIDLRTLTSPSVVHYRFFKLFGARRSTVTKFTSLELFHCTRAPIA
ncbi:hypothetical protein TNCV_4453771 [Trichonephila clavipes]|nr:hypothetical protein TNCV_4453771 [Trichonephila clavipes]